MKVCNKYKTLLVTDMTIKQFDRYLKRQAFKAKVQTIIRKIVANAYPCFLNWSKT